VFGALALLESAFGQSKGSNGKPTTLSKGLADGDGRAAQMAGGVVFEQFLYRRSRCNARSLFCPPAVMPLVPGSSRGNERGEWFSSKVKKGNGVS
jgi:hypothetical protein